jgi:hypothetical protein
MPLILNRWLARKTRRKAFGWCSGSSEQYPRRVKFIFQIVKKLFDR